jgi:hypothetical protein
MSTPVEPILTESDDDDDSAFLRREGRQRRLGILRTDMHTMYEVPFQKLEALSTPELRKIANNGGGTYSQEMRVKARGIIRMREDPQDRDSIGTEM